MRSTSAASGASPRPHSSSQGAAWSTKPSCRDRPGRPLPGEHSTAVTVCCSLWCPYTSCCFPPSTCPSRASHVFCHPSPKPVLHQGHVTCHGLYELFLCMHTRRRANVVPAHPALSDVCVPPTLRLKAGSNLLEVVKNVLEMYKLRPHAEPPELDHTF